jgi:hypothetical protein
VEPAGAGECASVCLSDIGEEFGHPPALILLCIDSMHYWQRQVWSDYTRDALRVFLSLLVVGPRAEGGSGLGGVLIGLSGHGAKRHQMGSARPLSISFCNRNQPVLVHRTRSRQRTWKGQQGPSRQVGYERYGGWRFSLKGTRVLACGWLDGVGRVGRVASGTT